MCYNKSMGKKQEKMMIIDGNALIHRSFHAIPATMATKSGEPTNAVFGFTSVLLKSLEEFKPDYVILTFDKKGKTFRHNRYEDYKATRVKAPQELYDQIARAKEVAKALGIPVFEKDGFEADDLIGTISKNNKKMDNIIVTGDKDTLQLVDDRIKVYTMSRGLAESVLYDANTVKEKYLGLCPEQIVDYKALRGDPSDNIPGVKGIGEKTAIELLNEFESLDELYRELESKKENISKKIKPRIADLLLKHKDEAYLSKELATIKCDVDLDIDMKKAKAGGFDRERAIKLFSELEFKALLPRISNLEEGGQTSKKNKNGEQADKFSRNEKEFKYELIHDEDGFKKFLKKLKKQNFFAFDTETTGVKPLRDDLLGIGFSWEKGEGYYISLKRERTRSKKDKTNLFNYGHKEENKDHPWLKELKDLFENENIKKAAHNAKFDARVMQAAGIDIKGLNFDTMLASYLLNPGSRQHNLDALAFSEFGWEKISKQDLLGSGRNKIDFSQVVDEKMYLYCCEDADFTWRLIERLESKLKEKELLELFYSIEMPLIPVLAKMENTGMILDKEVLLDLGEKVDKKIASLEKKIYDISGKSFNMNSPAQLKEVLFDDLGISTEGINKTKTGFSTAASELDKLKDKHEIISLIRQHRELSKLLNTYIHSLPELVNPDTGRVHTSFNQTITATGRLSSTDPNLQNIPARTELGQKIRKAFKAEQGYELVSLDYSQIELRLAAHLSGDKKMIDFFKKGEDIHSATAAAINEIEPEEVTKEMRREAKAVNFGILYGQGPYGLSQSADIPFGRAKSFIEEYFKVFKGVKEYIDKSIEKAREKGYAETMFGRKRFIPEINSSVGQVKAGAERIAINMPLQGTNADMIKKAMIEIQDRIDNDWEGEVRMLVQVHDELLFEIKKERTEKIAKEISKIMKGKLKLKVPIVVDIEAGDNWGEIKRVIKDE